jgi:hypothetical protein
MSVLLAVMLLFSPFVDRHVPFSTKFYLMGVFTLGWVITPGAALVVGSLPLLGQTADTETPKGLTQSASS